MDMLSGQQSIKVFANSQEPSPEEARELLTKEKEYRRLYMKARRARLMELAARAEPATEEA